MTDIKQVFAANMKQYRKTLGLSQNKLAEKVETATNYIAMIELGRKFPSAQMIERIAEALQVDSPELFITRTMAISSMDSLYKLMISDIEKVIYKRINEVTICNSQ